MTDEDMKRLLGGAPDRSLAGLEAAVWRGVAARRAADRTVLALSALQAGALVLVLATSLAWGLKSARERPAPALLAAFSPQLSLAPSSRLIGEGE